MMAEKKTLIQKIGTKEALRLVELFLQRQTFRAIIRQMPEVPLTIGKLAAYRRDHAEEIDSMKVHYLDQFTKVPRLGESNILTKAELARLPPPGREETTDTLADEPEVAPLWQEEQRMSWDKLLVATENDEPELRLAKLTARFTEKDLPPLNEGDRYALERRKTAVSLVFGLGEIREIGLRRVINRLGVAFFLESEGFPKEVAVLVETLRSDAQKA